MSPHRIVRRPARVLLLPLLLATAVVAVGPACSAGATRPVGSAGSAGPAGPAGPAGSVGSAGATPSAAVPGAGRGARYTASLPRAIGDLPVARERRAGYDRDTFVHWVDADSDGCDTREEVLIEESREDVAVGSGCSLSGGRWFSWYDGATWTETGDVDIDHQVPLAEAWDSGARTWRPATRQRFANDLGDPRSLVAVTDEVNASKGDRDVREWLPARQHCRYLRDQVAVKHRWRLRVDRPEKRAMRALARDCGDRRVTVRLAR